MALKRIALLLALIGGINWGLVGAFKFNLVEFLLGFSPALVSVAYIAVGVCACYALFAYMIK